MKLSNALLLFAFTASVSALYVDRASGEHFEVRAATNSCVSGSYGLRRGDGYKDYCCKDQSDCWNQCIKGKCDGPSKPNTKTTKTTTTSKPASSSCISGSEGRRRGDGYNGYCCQDHSDCWDQCIKGKCNGPSKPSTTSKTTTATPKTTTKTTSKTTKTSSTKTTKTSTSKTTTATTSTKTPTTSSTTTTTATPTTTTTTTESPTTTTETSTTTTFTTTTATPITMTTTTESPTTTTETSTSTSTTTTTESPTTTTETSTSTSTTTTTESPTTTTETSTSTSTTTTTESPTTTVSTTTTSTTTTTTVPLPTVTPLGCYQMNFDDSLVVLDSGGSTRLIDANWCLNYCLDPTKLVNPSNYGYIAITLNHNTRYSNPYLCFCLSADFQPLSPSSITNGCDSYRDDGMGSIGNMESDDYGPPSSMYVYKL